ncbi:MAG: ribosome-associated translation inhibitor RaiA [Gammaproteobacteria bacterium]|nr:ribosome-associated translation inhibitor RaiA [Gammaproteobacteria bacterium]
MQINISGHQIDVTPALRDYVTGKFQRIERHFDNLTDAHVVLSTEKSRHRAEATLHLTGANLFADSEHDDMYAAIDLLIDKLDKQVRKRKEKLTDHHRAEGGLKTQQST